MIKNLVITGKPGIGKTSLIKEVTFPFRERLGGFFTEQILRDGKRFGFKLVTFDRREAVLASKDFASDVRINKYGVDLPALDGVGVQALRDARLGRDMIVVDEIGSMEILSPNFRDEVIACLNCPKPVLATIRQNTNVFTDSLKQMDQTRLIDLTRQNYYEVKGEVRKWLEEIL